MLKLALMAGASILGSVLSGQANKSAAKKATNAQLEAERRKEGAYTTARAENAALLNPYITRGNAAQNEFMRALGVGGSAANGTPPSVAPAAPGAASGSPDWNAYLNANQDVRESVERQVAAGTYGSREEAAAAHYEQNGREDGRALPTVGADTAPAGPAPFYGPEFGERPVIERPEVGERPDMARPDVGARPDFGPRPTANLPGFEGFDYGLDDYTESPAFQHQLSRGMESVAQNKAFSGALKSGAATNSALEFATQLAYDDFAAERQFAYGAYKDARDTKRGYAESDLNRAEHGWEFNVNRGDRNYLDDTRRIDTNYQFDANRSDDNWEFGANRTDRNFIDTRNFASDVYGIDRGYATNRFDARQSALGGIANQGYGATGALVSGNNQFAQQLATGYGAQGDATANNYLRQGALNGQLWSDLGQGASYLAGAYGQAGAGAPGGTPPYVPAYQDAAAQRFMSAQPAQNPFLQSLYR